MSNNIAETPIEPFSANVLVDETFRIDWNDVRKVPKEGANGGRWDAPCILVEVKGFVTPLWVELARSDYEKLRLLKMQGILVYTCSNAAPKNGQKYMTRIFAGGKDW